MRETVSSVSPLAQEHPEWLARRADGELQPIVEAHQGQAQYILDVTHPGARQWLRDLLHRLTEEWGYDFIKTDFSEWTLLSQERYFDPTASASRAYRIGVEAMRQGMGALRHMLDCGPGPSALGLIDSMRIELTARFRKTLSGTSTRATLTAPGRQSPNATTSTSVPG